MCQAVCVALEDSGCQIPIVSERMFEWCCGNAIVMLHGFGKSHTVQASLVNLKVRVSDKDCDNGGGEAVEIPLVCAVSDLSAAEYDMILPADVVYKLKAIPVTSKVSCCDASGVCDEGPEIPNEVTGEDTQEKVDEVSVDCEEVCGTRCRVKDECDVRIDDVIISTPARVSCNVTSIHGEETEVLRHSQEQRLESTTQFEEVSDRVGGCPAHRDEKVRRIQEMADLGPRRTRSRGIQDITAAYKSEVGPAIRGPRGSGRVRPSVSSMASPGVSVVLVMLCWIFHSVRSGTAFLAGISCDITNCNENWTRIMYLYDLLCSDCISSCNIVQGQFTIFAFVSWIVFSYMSTLSTALSV